MELARQEQNGHHREKRQRRPFQEAHRRSVADLHKQFIGTLLDPPENIAEPVKEPVGHKEPDGHERNQLDRRFEGNGKDQASVALRRIEPARSEDHGKGPEQQRNEPSLKIAALRFSREQGKGRCNCFELQSEIRGDPDHRHDRDQDREAQGLSVARRDEIRDRGDPVLLGQVHDLPEHDPPQRRHKRGADIDREKAEPRVRRLAHAAVEGPGGAVHGKGKGIDVGIRNEALPLRFLPFRKIGSGKEQEQIAENNAEQDQGREHLFSSVLPLREVRNDKNERDKDEPDDEQGGRQAAPKDAHDGPAEEQKADHEQQYPDIAFQLKIPFSKAPPPRWGRNRRWG